MADTHQTVSLPSTSLRLDSSPLFLVNDTNIVFTVFGNNTITQGMVHWKYISNKGKLVEANQMQIEIRMLIYTFTKYYENMGKNHFISMNI